MSVLSSSKLRVTPHPSSVALIKLYASIPHMPSVPVVGVAKYWRTLVGSLGLLE